MTQLLLPPPSCWYWPGHGFGRNWWSVAGPVILALLGWVIFRTIDLVH